MSLKTKIKKELISPNMFIALLLAVGLVLSSITILFSNFNLNNTFAMNEMEIDYNALSQSQPSDKIKVYFNKGVDHSYQEGNGRETEGNVDFSELISNQIHNTEKTIDLAVMYLEDLRIIEALKKADQKGIKIRIVTDQEEFIALKESLTGTNIEVIENNGGLVDEEYGTEKSIMHYKFGLFDAELEDKAILLTTSANWTDKGFITNANNLVTIQDQPLVQAYLDEFEQMWDGKFNRDKDLTKHRGEIFEIDGRIVELWMSPCEDPFTSFQMRYVNLFNEAKESIYFATFNFTLPRLSQELEKKYKEGLDIRGLANDGSWDINGSVFFDMRGVEHFREFTPWTEIPYEGIRHDAIDGEQNLHYKYFVIDNNIAITGASNPTVSAVFTNDEDILVIHDPLIANEFNQNFFYHFKRYGGLTKNSVVKISDFNSENDTVTLENLTNKDLNIENWKIVAVDNVYIADELYPKNELTLEKETIGTVVVPANGRLEIDLPHRFLTNNRSNKDDGEIYLFDDYDLLHHMVWY